MFNIYPIYAISMLISYFSNSVPDTTISPGGIECSLLIALGD